MTENSDNFTQFKTLHHSDSPLVLTNIWDAASAKILESAGATALATSSASLAWSLGYGDGYQLPLKQLIEAVTRISRVTALPITVDIENGYSQDPKQVSSLVAELGAIGVVGVNIEDGNESPELLAQKVESIKSEVPGMFVNARTDVYLAQLVDSERQEQETLNRLLTYQHHGADCLFVPGLTNLNVVARIREQINSPLNLMATSIDEISRFRGAVVARISTGPFSFIRVYQQLLNESASALGQNKMISPLDYLNLNNLMISD